MTRPASRIPWAALACTAVVGLALYHAYLQWWLCDDAYISFRYARQLTDGYGLVFNRGERVEGYTNFLWVLEVALGMVFGQSPEATSLFLSVIATVALFVVVARTIRSSPLEGPSAWAAVLGLLLLAANRSIAVWTTSGLETRQFTLFSVLAVVFAGTALKRFWTDAPQPAGAPRHELMAALFAALAEATRPEGGLIVVCVGGAYVALGPGRLAIRRALAKTAPDGDPSQLREAIVGAAAVVLPALALVALHYVFRRAYYGDWLPNTYYAKHVRAWPESGDKYFVAAWIEHGGFLVIPLAVLGTVARLRKGDPFHLVSWAILVPHTIYVRRIGGDHFEFRPLDLHWPLLVMAAVDALLWLAAIGRSAVPHARLRLAGTAVLTLLLFEYSTVVQRAYENETQGKTSRSQTYKLRAFVKPTSTREIGWLLPARLMRMYNDASFYCVDHQSCTRQGEHRAYWTLLDKEFGPYRTMTAEEAHAALPDDLVWARDAVGFAPYVLPGVTVIDLFGLTDRTIARNPVSTPNERRIMAHDRRPPPGYLTKRGINIQLGAASRTQGEALRHGYWAVRVRPDLWIPFRTFDDDWVMDRFRHRHIFSQFWFDPAVATNNRAWIDGKYTHGIAFIGRFDEGGLDGWNVNGESARIRPSVTADKGVEPIGTGFLTTDSLVSGPRGMAVVESPTFAARGILAFIMKAGGAPGTEVRLKSAGATLQAWPGNGSRAFELVTMDLEPWKAAPLTIQVVDQSTTASIAVDQVMLVVPDGDEA